MAIYIEQSPDEVRQSFNLQRRAEIISVRLSTASTDSYTQPQESRQELSVSVGHTCSAEMMPDGTLSTNIDFAVFASQDESVRIFEVKCRFQVTYQLEQGYQPTPEEINAFSGANAVFNAWPYFREFVQNTCLRMGFPGSPSVPFLKLIPKSEANLGPDEKKNEVLVVKDSRKSRSSKPPATERP
jgi:hypothetical protein